MSKTTLILPPNLELQYVKYANSIIHGFTKTRKEWLKENYPNAKVLRE